MLVKLFCFTVWLVTAIVLLLAALGWSQGTWQDVSGRQGTRAGRAPAP
jgi:hypothetical protein